MAIESAAELVRYLAKELERSGTEFHDFAEITGIRKDRLELLETGAWQDLTLREITAISENLDIDLFDL